MAAVGDIYRIIDHQTYASDPQDMLNVWHYEIVSITGSCTAALVGAEFIADKLPSIINIQSSFVVHQYMEVINLNDPLDFATVNPTALQGTGVRTGEALPQFVAASFIMRRASRASRNGWKRFVGVAEGDQANGIPTGSYLTVLNGSAGVFSTSLLATGFNAVPVIWRPSNAIPPGQGIGFNIAVIEFSSISSQNTRKR